ncbi:MULTISPECIES: chromosome segregation protein SMC [Corallococcus]|uniref:chromosome segregation protein SMC n=1 Tax=Corallococcus TaxID=83461 RepID=UPI001180D932|nr:MULTISPECIES: chromosome segregation protein SMC [Corallococcus]NBD13190.1 chromosome segregation protein SMC [Corallococcus silvisoli]TSC23324.1 chromosome segregation protein SMC [Corallococcus sp. Z5C101001]
MRIKRLDITGFKSFMERSVFSFDEGVTGVVGPNGCGKSNVVDAIRWVMGEQSAKNLRGRGMEDVIFNGSENKPPLSMAEVSLTFLVDDTDTLAPQYQGFSEITVTRRLFRNGDSEYLINKTLCRLLDITELFLGTGVGTKAYSIIEQGRVGLIVSSKPEDRRHLLEEAAGVTKYKARRKAAERKMEATEANLLRVNDITGELEKRLDTLSRQAKKAEKYRKLKARMREIDLHSASHRSLELMAEKRVLQSRLENLGGEEREGLDRVKELEEVITRRRAELDAEGAALQQFAGEVHGLESALQRDAQELAYGRRDFEETGTRVDAAQAELDALLARQAEVVETMTAREAELSGIAGSYKEDEVAMQVALEEQRRVSVLQTEISLRLEQERAGLVAVATRLANHESNLVNLARQRTDLEARRAKLSAELETLHAQEQALDGVRTQAAKHVEDTRHLASELAERRGQEEEALTRTREAFTENEVQVIALREELSDKRSRLSSLEDIQKNYDGFDRGVRAVMVRAAEAAREQGIFGLVADVLTVNSPRYERAVEAALGERLQHVIVDSREKGVELVEYLKGHAEGRGTFLPVPSGEQGRGLVEPDLTRPGVLAHALREVSCEPALEPVLRLLLGDVVIVQDLLAAREYAEASPVPCTLVTLEGEVFRTDGSITGGEREGAAVGALQKKREIAELASEVARVEERYNEILTRHYTLQKQMGQAEAVLKGLGKEQHAEEVNLASQEKDLHKASEDLARVRERLRSLEGEAGQLSQSHTALANEEESSRGEVAHGQADREAREERVRQYAGELEGLRQRADMASSDLMGLRVKVAAGSERGESARKELESLVSQRRDMEARVGRLQGTVTEGRAKVETLQGRLAELESTREQRAEAHRGAAETLEARRAAHTAATTEVREQDTAFRELRGRLDELMQGLSQISLREKEIALEMEHLASGIRERYQLELAAELHQYHLLPPLSDEVEGELKDLRAQVEKMGEINLTAIDEHAELSKRYEFLSTQRQDLQASISQLKEAIVRIDATSRERFKQTFDVVNDKFQAIFPRLFGGGRASLVLTQEGPNGEPGVEIVAQPPGKKLQSVNLLSGGEKALTAVALIFGIFLIKPTPFCLLDEVDAPLDEGNVGRYNDMVKEMSRQSQFILITHNKRTMEVADTLYGVTMEEPGISKLVSVKMREAAAHNDDKVPAAS